MTKQILFYINIFFPPPQWIESSINKTLWVELLITKGFSLTETLFKTLNTSFFPPAGGTVGCKNKQDLAAGTSVSNETAALVSSLVL